METVVAGRALLRGQRAPRYGWWLAAPSTWMHRLSHPVVGLREWVAEEAVRRQVPIAAEATGEGPLPVGLVLLTHYKAGERWEPLPVPAGQAVLRLLEHGLMVREAPEKTLPALRALAERAAVLEGVRGEADQVVRWVMGPRRAKHGG